MDLGGNKVPMHLPRISRHELTRLAQTGQVEGLLEGHFANQAFVQSDMKPGGEVGLPKQGASAREVAARTGKVETLPTTIRWTGSKKKLSLRSLSGQSTIICHQRR
jgi:hypothetical protein